MTPADAQPPPDDALHAAIARVPAGPWAIGVSGGADSVALLALLRDRTDIAPHIVHLDHQARGAESAADAAFVANLARRWSLPATIATRTEIEPLVPHPPSNPSARYRALRLALFRDAVARHALAGVLLAHHADDQAETVLLRLLRGTTSPALAGMSPRTDLAGLLVLRPLLAVPRDTLRAHIRTRGLSWREDPSNAADAYARNRARKLLAAHPALADHLRNVGGAMNGVKQWLDEVTPRLPNPFPARTLADLPAPIAREAARRWLLARGAPPDAVTPDVAHRLILMAADAAAPPRQHFPGQLLVRRRQGNLFVEEIPVPASNRKSEI